MTFQPVCCSRRATCLVVASVAGLAAVVVPAPAARAQSIKVQVIAETGDTYTVGGNTYVHGDLGLPSLSTAASSSHWNLAVRGYPNNGSGNHVLFYTNSSSTVHELYTVPGGEAVLPSAQFVTAAYHITQGNVGVYSGNNLLPPYYQFGFFFGRPSAQGPFIAVQEYPVDFGGSTGIVVHGPTTSVLLVSTTADGFDEGVGRVTGPGADGDISFGRGNLFNVVFRGHHSTNPLLNGIFARRYDGTQPRVTVADNNTLNPFGGATFNFDVFNYEYLPVGHGQGAAWSTAEGGSGVCARPDLNGAVMRASDEPPYTSVHGNVSSAGAGMLAYEVTPYNQDKVIRQNLMGVFSDAVRREWITRRYVLGVSMSSEALVPNSYPLSFPQGGGFTLGFHAHQQDSHVRNAVYVTTIPRTGLDLGGMFGGDVQDHGYKSGKFKMQGGGNTLDAPEESDFVLVMAHDELGGTHWLKQQYGAGLGVDSGSHDDYPDSINTTTDGRREGLSFIADYDMIVDAATFTGLDLGASVRFLLDGALVTDATFEGNQVSIMQGLQYIHLDSLFVPAGSTFTLEHGGGFDDGFRVSSLIFDVVTGCAADFNSDGAVNTLDFVLYLNAWASGDPLADWNQDGVVNTIDFVLYLNDWATGCP